MIKSSINNQCKIFLEQYKEMWWETDKNFHELGLKTGYWYKKKKERETEKFIKTFIEYIEKFPAGPKEKIIWKEKVNTLITNFVNSSNIIDKKHKDILFSKELMKSTEEFVNEARSFNDSMAMEDIGQAMRNVWIMNIIQLLLNKKVEFTPAMFGYSMLYPYTDNYLDDNNISMECKKNFNSRFEVRLKGEKISPENEYEIDIFNLVSRIESQYERKEYSEVFQSLLLIHNAQRKSIIQQDKKSVPYEKDILGISFEKGGSSVLADGYLVNGNLSKKNAFFFFGYGILLQICDDLQDAKEDYDNNHMTIISQIATKYPLDSITNSLINFTLKLTDDMKEFSGDNIDVLKDIIRKNCILLIYFAIAKNKKFYSGCYYNEIKNYFPYTPRFMNGFYKRLKKKYSRLKDCYNGIKVEEILMYAFQNEEN
ncbi:hypothetical protein SH2C18_22650 [Clostridium sediminicola]|uniref:hypothetical protein n=1 Tax=Clostridium sediminicola TaxID=3114879 RepID=UPI0031F1C61E